MPRKILHFIFSFCLLFVFHTYAYAQVPRTLSYQGKLTSTTGAPLDGIFSITFSLYDTAAGGTALWSETKNVAVVKGLLSTALGDTTPIGLIFDKQYFVGVKIGNDAELSPRQPLQSVPYALALPGVTIDPGTSNVGINGRLNIPTVGPGPMNNALLIGALQDIGTSSFELSIGLPTSSTHWPFGIMKGGKRLFSIDDGGGAMITGGVITGGNIEVGGADFRLIGRGGGNGNNGGVGRALVDAGPGGGLIINYANDFGNVTINSGLSCHSITLTSSQRFKSNVKPIIKPIETLSKLQGVTYQWDKEHGDKKDIGFIAEDVAKVLPELVTMESDGKNAKGMDYSHLVALTVEAIKAQQRQIIKLEDKIAKKDQFISNLARRVKKLEASINRSRK